MARKESRVLSKKSTLELPDLKGKKKDDDSTTPKKKSAVTPEDEVSESISNSMDSDLEKINEEIRERSLSDSDVSDEEKADTVDDDIFDPKTFGTKGARANEDRPLESIAEESEDENTGGPVIKDKGLAAFMKKDKAEKDKKKTKRRGKKVPLRPFQAPMKVIDCTSDVQFEKQKFMPIYPANHQGKRWPGPEERNQYIFDRMNIEKSVFDPF